MNYDEIEGLGCSISAFACDGVSSGGENVGKEAPEWVYSTNYWLGFASENSDQINAIVTNAETPGINYFYAGTFGVRLVITIPIANIQKQ